jgi:hypothetical protein
MYVCFLVKDMKRGQSSRTMSRTLYPTISVGCPETSILYVHKCVVCVCELALLKDHREQNSRTARGYLSIAGLYSPEGKRNTRNSIHRSTQKLLYHGQQLIYAHIDNYQYE